MKTEERGDESWNEIMYKTYSEVVSEVLHNCERKSSSTSCNSWKLKTQADGLEAAVFNSNNNHEIKV